MELLNLIKNLYDVPVEDGMTSKIMEWEDIYCGQPHWMRDTTLGLGKTICQTLSSQVLTEANIKADGESDKAQFIEAQFEKHLLPRLKHNLEKAMATGGMVLRPYITEDGINIDFCRQGQFVPLAFDDDGNITDIAFGEQIIVGKYTYTRIERQTYDGKDVVITNKAYVSKGNGLGKNIALTDVDAWATIDPNVTLEDTEGTMFGYYRVPLANNVEIESPLGISIFSPALNLMKSADYQFERLDWEYEGGQIAIDISEDAIIGEMDDTKERLYRQVDMNSDDTYKAFTPSLRDANFGQGLEKYLMRIEDTIGLSRGSLAEVGSEARTATEMRILKQRSYNTIVENQDALGKALESLHNAMKYLSEKYFKVKGNSNLTLDWNDSVLEDYQTELDRHIQLMDAGIESKLEVRMWAKGEDEETAQANLDKIDSPTDIYDDLDYRGEDINNTIDNNGIVDEATDNQVE